MSRKIDLGKPLSDGDRQYLLDRNRSVEVVDNDLTHGKLRDMTDEEIAEAQAQEFVDSAGKRTPSLMDNDLIEAQRKQREDDEMAQLETYASEKYEAYDLDDVAFVQTLTDDELREKLAERELDVSGTRPEMQKRLLDAMTESDDED